VVKLIEAIPGYKVMYNGRLECAGSDTITSSLMRKNLILLGIYTVREVLYFDKPYYRLVEPDKDGNNW